MYTNASLAGNLVPPAAAVGTVAVLPNTGVESITTVAVALFIGLCVWAIIYFYRLRQVSADRSL